MGCGFNSTHCMHNSVHFVDAPAKNSLPNKLWMNGVGSYARFGLFSLCCISGCVYIFWLIALSLAHQKLHSSRVDWCATVYSIDNANQQLSNNTSIAIYFWHLLIQVRISLSQLFVKNGYTFNYSNEKFIWSCANSGKEHEIPILQVHLQFDIISFWT